MVRLETSAVDASAVNAAAVDGFKVEPVLLAEVRLARRFWLGGGAYYRWKRLELGLSYQSRPLGSDVPGVEVAAPSTTTFLPPRDANAPGVPLTCANGQSGRCVFGDIAYRLPDVVIGGATWHVAPGVEVTAMVRWLWLHLHDRIDIRVSAPTLDQSGLPQHIVLYRGFHDVWDSLSLIHI